MLGIFFFRDAVYKRVHEERKKKITTHFEVKGRICDSANKQKFRLQKDLSERSLGIKDHNQILRGRHFLNQNIFQIHHLPNKVADVGRLLFACNEIVELILY